MRLLYTLILAVVHLVVSAQITISGKVTLEGETEGAIVVNISQIGNPVNGTTTNFDGTYSIDVPDENAVLDFSYIGYTTQTITVGSQRFIDVILYPASSQLDEVVVTGYLAQKTPTISGIVASLQAKDFS